MRDVVVIGGGLSGLAAAYELNRKDIAFTIIEVKPRLGGSIRSEAQQGFLLDAGDMLHQIENADYFTTFLHQIGLDGAVTPTVDGYLFNNGTDDLIDALSQTFSTPVMYRMAVSTLGWLDNDRCSICLENGMLLDARAVIVAAPARHAERMFYTLVPEISELLLDYPYEPVVQVSLGYRNVDADLFSLVPPIESPVRMVQATIHPARVSAEGLLLHVDMRYDPEAGVPQDPITKVSRLMNWSVQPATSLAQVWPEAKPVSWQKAEHITMMKAIASHLPPNVALCGSDYLSLRHAPTLEGRIRQGIAAAHRVLDVLQSG